MFHFFERFCLQRAILNKNKELVESLIVAKKDNWIEFLKLLSLISGGGLFAFGVIFFIAANWDSIGKFFKLFMVEGLMFAGVAGWYLSKNPLISKVSLSLSYILLGGLLALIGQIYQTGANSWELFFYWGALGAFWVIADRFEPLWILEIIVINTAALLYSSLHFRIFSLSIFSNYTILIVINLALLVVFEALNQLNIYKTSILVRLLATLVTTFMTLSALDSIFSHHSHFNLYPFIFAGLFYYFLKKDAYIISILALSFDITILALLGRAIFSINRLDFIVGAFIMSIASISLAIFTIKFIKNLSGESNDLQ